MQNIITSLAKLNFELLSHSEGSLNNLSDFEISSDYKTETTSYELERFIMPYIIFNLKNYKDEYIFQFLDLLDKFYENRNTSHSNRLVLENLYKNYLQTDNVIIKPMCGNTLVLENIETQKEILDLVKKEFSDLGIFLSKNINK